MAWPRYIFRVTDHAVLRYIQRILAVDVAAIKARLVALGAEPRDAVVLSCLEAQGIAVEAIRRELHAQADSRKRDATHKHVDDDRFVIPGKNCRFLVGKDGHVVTVLHPAYGL